MHTVFSQIVEGTIPAHTLYEDDDILVFLDAHPNNYGHALVIPKETYRNIFDLPTETFTAMAAVAQRVARALKESLACDGVNIVMNNEAAAGQEVFHAHLHIIPRYENDGVFAEPKKTTYADGEAAATAEKIRAVLAH